MPQSRQAGTENGDLAGVESDARLVERVCSGDASAEEAVYRRYAPGILDLVTGLLGSRADAQDVLHDTFVIGLREIRRLRAPGAARAWFMQIAVSLVHRRLRRGRLLRWFGLSEQTEESPDAPLESLADPSASPDVLAELGMLDRVIKGLPAAHRIAWMLRHVEGHSLPEVAGICNCSLATAKRRIAAADQRIRSHVRLEERE
jgi:RNA polymerase sigma-70 factor, ECF subfamily